jgi:phosphohistidine phosphatase
MRLLVIRHARAGSVKEFAKSGRDDDLRPLTGDGVERMRAGAAGLQRLVGTVDVLATSPLVRARETAEIVRSQLDGPVLTELEELRPGRPPSEFVEWLQGAGSMETIAIVGHDMHLSRLVGLLLSGRAEPLVTIKKGAAVLLAVRSDRRRHAGWRSGRLLWSLTPRQLRMLGGTVTSGVSR